MPWIWKNPQMLTNIFARIQMDWSDSIWFWFLQTRLIFWFEYDTKNEHVKLVRLEPRVFCLSLWSTPRCHVAKITGIRESMGAYCIFVITKMVNQQTIYHAKISKMQTTLAMVRAYQMKNSKIRCSFFPSFPIKHFRIKNRHKIGPNLWFLQLFTISKLKKLNVLKFSTWPTVNRQITVRFNVTIYHLTLPLWRYIENAHGKLCIIKWSRYLFKRVLMQFFGLKNVNHW